jgi:signal transduction histidine kinase/ActR/RegA family two-component response regulator
VKVVPSLFEIVHKLYKKPSAKTSLTWAMVTCSLLVVFISHIFYIHSELITSNKYQHIELNTYISEFLNEEHALLFLLTILAVIPIAVTCSSIFQKFISSPLIESELKKAIEQSEKAAQAKEHFFANISHEIRTPLNGILGMTDLAIETSQDVETISLLEIVRMSGESLLAVVNDLLDYSKIGSGAFKLSPSLFDPKDLVKNIYNLIEIQAKKKQQKLEIICDHNIPNCILGDSQRIQQILLNFMGNAIKFSPEGGTITLGSKATFINEYSVKIHFWVKDQGIGINPEHQRLIFEPFQQADGTITRRFGGTGLGLAISKNLAEIMGGIIRLDSELNKGSTFHCELLLPYFDSNLSLDLIDFSWPEGLFVISIITDNILEDKITQLISAWKLNCIKVKKSELPNLALNKSQTYAILSDSSNIDEVYNDLNIITISPNSTKEDTFKKLVTTKLKDNNSIAKINTTKQTWPKSTTDKKILVAEDNSINQALIQKLLNKCGYQVTIVKNGNDAINAYKKEDFDLILMDCHMPVLDGLEATRKIRNLESKTNKHVPIIALTALAMENDRENCIKAGMDDFLTKPIRSQELYKSLDKNLQKL